MNRFRQPDGSNLPTRSSGSNDADFQSNSPWLAEQLRQLPSDIQFLHKFGIGLPTLSDAVRRSEKLGCSASEALQLNGDISEADYYRGLALFLGLPFVDEAPSLGPTLHKPIESELLNSLSSIVPTRIGLDDDLMRERAHIAPADDHIGLVQRFVARYPQVKSNLAVTTPSANRRIFVGQFALALTHQAISGLLEKMPDLSASTVVTAWQSLFFLTILASCALAASLTAMPVLLAVHVTITMFYIGCVALRVYAAMVCDPRTRRVEPSWPEEATVRKENLPVYSILVALYDEATQIPDLLSALNRIDWPQNRLEIKLICEADDLETIAAIRAEGIRSHTEVVCVPPSWPRTKPKALNYALPLCRGRFLVLYDAEDRPDPQQLREAYAKFNTSPPELVCLQAPLIIHNYREGWFPRLFAAEYSALFDGLLPMLARIQAPLPLGGTSNHFKRAALEKAGGWDPYNVTEDADLGMRLARMGFLTATISRPTYEEAPTAFAIWLRQRTRWFKGWLQTWLVHMRHPIDLWYDLGAFRFLMFHFLITGLILSALSHPFLLLFVLFSASDWLSLGSLSFAREALLVLDTTCIVVGYVGFVILAWRTLPIRGLSSLRVYLIGVPAYWMLISIGAWRAVWHLIRRPFEWEKTPHGLRRVGDPEL